MIPCNKGIFALLLLAFFQFSCSKASDDSGGGGKDKVDRMVVHLELRYDSSDSKYGPFHTDFNCLRVGAVFRVGDAAAIEEVTEKVWTKDIVLTEFPVSVEFGPYFELRDKENLPDSLFADSCTSGDADNYYVSVDCYSGERLVETKRQGVWFPVENFHGAFPAKSRGLDTTLLFLSYKSGYAYSATFEVEPRIIKELL